MIDSRSRFQGEWPLDGEGKQKQRRFIHSARTSIGSGLAARKSLAAVSRILAHEAYRRSEVILVYSAHHGELNVSELIETAQAEGKHIAYPVIDGQGGMLSAIPEEKNGAICIQPGRYGEKEPALTCSRIVLPEELDLILVPGIGYDRAGYRLGWGSGHYDRYLPLCRNAFYLAVAFEEQMIDHIDHEPWDMRMHAIVTDKDVYAIG